MPAGGAGAPYHGDAVTLDPNQEAGQQEMRGRMLGSQSQTPPSGFHMRQKDPSEVKDECFLGAPKTKGLRAHQILLARKHKRNFQAEGR